MTTTCTHTWRWLNCEEHGEQCTMFVCTECGEGWDLDALVLVRREFTTQKGGGMAKETLTACHHEGECTSDMYRGLAIDAIREGRDPDAVDYLTEAMAADALALIDGKHERFTIEVTG